MDNLEIRPAQPSEFQAAIEWAASEGWNPGLDDLAAFHATDPDGFIMGFRDGRPVSSISVVRYASAFGFLGFYIVHPDFRGSGAGIATWKAGMAHLQGRTIGLDGVVDQQENYRKSGFVFAGRNIRHTGTLTGDLGMPAGQEIRPLLPADMTALQAFDQAHFGAPRETFLHAWLTPAGGERRTSQIALDDGRIAGYGTIRRCRSGFKIGPLFAASRQTAEGLVQALCRELDGNDEISLDTPEDNTNAVQLARDLGLQPVFETARMYKGTPPSLSLGNIYGITSFELG